MMPVMVRMVVRIKHDIHLQSRDAFFVDPPPVELKRLDADFLQFAFDIGLVRARVNKRCQRHVAADAGETVEI